MHCLDHVKQTSNDMREYNYDVALSAWFSCLFYFGEPDQVWVEQNNHTKQLAMEHIRGQGKTGL